MQKIKIDAGSGAISIKNWIVTNGPAGTFFQS